MGKEMRNKHFKHRNQGGGGRPYQKDGWRGHHRNTRGGGRGGGGHHHTRNENQGGQPYQRQPFVPKVNLREDQVGITEYVSSAPGFTGVVKSRFSDFHVNEIDLNGAVMELNDLSLPKPVDDALSAEEVEAARIELQDVLTTELWTQIATLAAAKANDQIAAVPIEIEVSQLDKEQRTKIHKVVKKLYSGKLVSTTIGLAATAAAAKDESVSGSKDADVQERKFIKIMKPKGRDRNRWGYPGEFVHFLVHKENMDTSEVATAIADRMNMRPSGVNYCGTKDKRAKTTQKFCIKRREPGQILGAIKTLYNVHVGNFTFSNEVLKLGDLKGNRFRIALRHVSGNQLHIEQALTDIRERGFINYFGLQRFGNCAAIPTYEVGVALLKSDYKLACELILKPRDNDLHFMRAIRETWWRDRNSASASAMFRGGDKFIEKRLLDGLVQYGEQDFAAALRKIPRNMLLLYPHAFQSLVFNTIASRRIKEFGMKLIVGDLVYRNKDELDATEEQLPEDDVDEEAEETTKTETNDDDEIAVEKIEEENKSAAVVVGDSIYKRKVKALTAEEIASGAYTLFDVVLPMPGYDITYPENIVATWYAELLQANDLSSEKLRHRDKTLAMAGAYRKLLLQPTQMSWKFCNYDDAESTLIVSDWELLKPKNNKFKPKDNQIAQPEEEKNEDEQAKPTEGKFKALLLDFCLPPSAYATMVLRELLKCDTSAASQTQLEKGERQKAVDKQEKKEAEEKSTDAELNTETDKVVEVQKRKTSSDDAADLIEKSDTVTEAETAAAAKKAKPNSDDGVKE